MLCRSELSVAQYLRLLSYRILRGPFRDNGHWTQVAMGEAVDGVVIYEDQARSMRFDRTGGVSQDGRRSRIEFASQWVEGVRWTERE